MRKLDQKCCEFAGIAPKVIAKWRDEALAQLRDALSQLAEVLAERDTLREELEWQLEAIDQGFLPTEDEGWQCTECDMEAVNIGEIEHSEECCSGRMRKALARV